MPDSTEKKIKIGIGMSKNKDSYMAAKEAAEKARSDCDGIVTYSFVFTNTNFDQHAILRGINEVLGDRWAGASVDKQISNLMPYDKDIVVSVLCISSEYLHFGVGVADYYKQNPKSAGLQAVKDAMANVKSDKYIDSYIQFTRTKTQDYSSIVKTPPYFIFTLVGSQTKKDGQYIGGEETNFLEGILGHTGPNIPIFGLGAGSDFDAFISPEVKDQGNYQFVNGKLYMEAGIVVFVISNLHFEINVEHGYSITSDFVVVSKLDESGFDIQELNGKEPVAEYCRLIGVSKEVYLSNPQNFSLTRPLGLTALDNSTYIKEAFPNPDGKTLHCTYKLRPNTAMNILMYNKDSLFNTMSDIISDSKKNHPNKRLSFTLFCNCCSRRLLMEGEEKKANQILNEKYPDLAYFGCYAFSEIGSTKTNMAQVHGETVTSLIVYDSLLTEI